MNEETPLINDVRQFIIEHDIFDVDRYDYAVDSLAAVMEIMNAAMKTIAVIFYNSYEELMKSLGW